MLIDAIKQHGKKQIEVKQKSIFDDSGMAFLWPDECEISVRRGGGKGLFLHRSDLYCHWFYVKGKFSMGSGRFLQRADGYSERFGITCIESCGCGG